MSNPHGMPPYHDVVLHTDMQQRIGLELVGFLCWFIANAEPTGHGSWVICRNIDDIAREIGWGKGKTREKLQSLATHGLIAVVEGKRHTNYGSTPRNYYLTHHPALARPHSHHSHHMSPQPDFRSPENRPAENQHLAVASPHKNQSENSKNGFSEHQVPVVVNKIHYQQQQEGDPKNGIPEAVTQALTSINWGEGFTIPTTYPWNVVLAVIAHLKAKNTVENKAGLLNSLFKRDTLMSYARDNNLLGVDGNSGLKNPPAPERMNPVEFDELAEKYPEWAETVESEAQRQTSLLGDPYIRPAVRLQVALLIPHPESPQPAALMLRSG